MTIGKDFTGKAETEMKQFSEKMAKEAQEKKQRTLNELRQTKDSNYTAPISHDEAKKEPKGSSIDWIKIEDIDNHEIPSSIMVWQENITDPECSRFQRATYFDGDDGFIQIYPHSSSAYFKKETHYIGSDLEGDTCQITHFAFVNSPNKA